MHIVMHEKKPSARTASFFVFNVLTYDNELNFKLSVDPSLPYQGRGLTHNAILVLRNILIDDDGTLTVGVTSSLIKQPSFKRTGVRSILLLKWIVFSFGSMIPADARSVDGTKVESAQPMILTSESQSKVESGGSVITIDMLIIVADLISPLIWLELRMLSKGILISPE